MSGLLPDDEIKNANNDLPWKKGERDRLLDIYLAGGNGASPGALAREFNRNKKSIERRLEDYTYNYEHRAEDYEPVQRISRIGKRFTENEQLIIRSHRKKGVAVEHTARLLARSVRELTVGDTKAGAAKVKQDKVFAPTLDLILALRYAFFVYQRKLVPDSVYDDLVAEEKEYGGGAPALQSLGDPKVCPRRIKTLALYLTEKADDEKEKE